MNLYYGVYLELYNIISYKKIKIPKIGQLTFIYFIWYGIGRFFIESLRTDSLMIGDIKVAQLVSIIMLITGIIMTTVLGKGSV